MKDVKLSILPPWSIYMNKLQALFDGDPEIAFNIDWSGEHPSVVLATNNPEKAAALMKLLPEEKVIGNIVLKIGIDCPKVSNIAFATTKELFETAFSKNPAFAYAVSTDGYWYIPFTYVVFANQVVQFFSDNLNDPHGITTTLYQEIAPEIFESAEISGNVAYCTALEGEESGKLSAPIPGGWNVDVSIGTMPQKVATAFSALNDMVGTSYTEIAYLGSQSVNGTNHAVLAEQTILTGKDTKNIVLIIFNEKDGDMNIPTVVSIERIVEGTTGFGGTAIDIKTNIPAEEKELFDKAFAQFVGSKVEPKALLATRVSEGVDYAFLVEVSAVVADAEKKVGIVTVNSLTKSVNITYLLSKPILGYSFTW